MSLNKTPIEWVKNPDGTQGYTWNPLTGCLNHTPEGLCLGGMFPCYAYKLANTRLKERYLDNSNLAPSQSGLKMHLASEFIDPFYPRFWEDRLYGLGGVSRVPKGIFVCDMSDLFGKGIPEEWTYRVITQIRAYPYHRFYLLTKQPQNLPQFSPFPPNCWVGVTATDRLSFNIAIYELLKVEAKVKYISFEPLLANPFEPPPSIPKLDDKDILLSTIQWVIIGAQTKPYKPPKIEWVEEIIRACDKAGIPVFLKDNLDLIIPWDGIFRVKYAGALRQEMPG